jgi:hypothetical protein
VLDGNTRLKILASQRNLARRPPKPAQGNGRRVQVRARRALWALNEASTSEVISWAYPQLMWGDRNRNHYNRAARRALQSIGAIRIGRAPTTGRPWLWRLKTPPSIMFAGGLIRVRFRTGSLSPCCRIWLLETVKNSKDKSFFELYES